MTTLAPTTPRTPRYGGRTEAWITARGFANANPGHKGKHGIYRATVTRPISPRRTRLAHVARVAAVFIGALPVSVAAHAEIVRA